MGAKIPPKWVPPDDRMIFISPTFILTGREVLAGREGRAGWVDRKKDAKNCMFKNPHFRIVFCCFVNVHKLDLIY